MPAMGLYGNASLRAFGRYSAKYTKPAAVIFDPGDAGIGTFASNADGYSMSGWAGNSLSTGHLYLSRAKTSGKWYWEYVYGGSPDDQVVGAIAAPPAAAGLGLNSVNTGGIASSLTITGWADHAWAGHATVGSAAVSAGSVLGMALDLSSATKTLKIYVDGALAVTNSWTEVGLSLYPAFTAYFSNPTPMAGQINLGAGHCTYSPPVGYKYL